jgi:hypothetical protein
MVIGGIQPGTFSPLTVSVRVLASTFSTVPRNVCSLFLLVGFLFACAPAGVDGVIEARLAPGAGLETWLAGCCALALATPISEMVFRGRPARQNKPRMAADITKEMTCGFRFWSTLLIRVESDPPALNIRHCRPAAAVDTNSAWSFQESLKAEL